MLLEDYCGALRLFRLNFYIVNLDVQWSEYILDVHGSRKFCRGFKNFALVIKFYREVRGPLMAFTVIVFHQSF